jgi:hypothetical protein
MGESYMQTMLNGQPTKVTPVRMLQILTAEWRVQVCLDIKRLSKQSGPAAERALAELRAELQDVDELANKARAAE